MTETHDPAGGSQVQVLPTSHLDLRPFGVATFPGLIGFPVTALVFALKALSIFATGSQLAGKTGWSRTIEDPIAFDSQQATRFHIGHPCQKRRTGIPVVAKNDGRAHAPPGMPPRPAVGVWPPRSPVPSNARVRCPTQRCLDQVVAARVPHC